MLGNLTVPDEAWTFLAGILVLAILYILVRPGSAAGTAVNDISKSLAALVQTTVS